MIQAKTTTEIEIESTAKELNITEIEVISTMQGLLAENGDEKGVYQLHVLKMKYYNQNK